VLEMTTQKVTILSHDSTGPQPFAYEWLAAALALLKEPPTEQESP